MTQSQGVRQHARPVFKDEIRLWCPRFQQWLSLDELLYLKMLNGVEKPAAALNADTSLNEECARGTSEVILELPIAKLSLKKMTFNFNSSRFAAFAHTSTTETQGTEKDIDSLCVSVTLW